jgi:hypothetical protein
MGNGKTHASVMYFIKDQSQNFLAWDRDPQSMLQNTLHRTEKDFNLKFLIGYKIKFYLSDLINSNSSQISGQSYSATAFRDRRVLTVMEEMV